MTPLSGKKKTRLSFHSFKNKRPRSFEEEREQRRNDEMDKAANRVNPKEAFRKKREKSTIILGNGIIYHMRLNYLIFPCCLFAYFVFLLSFRDALSRMKFWYIIALIFR